MASYYNYKFRTHANLKHNRKYSSKRMGPKDMWNFALTRADEEREKDSFAEIILLSEEAFALTEKPNLMFIEDLKLANAIKASKFSHESLNVEDGIKFVSFPRGFKVDGINASGVMCAWGNFNSRRLWMNTMQIQAGTKLSSLEYPDEYGLGYVSFTYNCPYHNGSQSRLQIPFIKLSDFIAAENPDELLEVFDEQLGDRIMDSSDERTYQLHIAQMALKTLVYAQAMPDKVVRGCPDRRAGGNKFKPITFIIKAPDSLHNQRSPTTVGFFFRQLRHEKYYKGEHKDKAIGSRWVFIPPHERGLRAETIKS